jgi:7-cyano-7-deazaguanine synthase
MNNAGKHSVRVLMSGGVDSTACAALYLAAGREVEGVFVDYGQAASMAESDAAQRVADYYGVSLRRLTLGGSREISAGLITGRNGFH